jgi:hypothetical protein
MTTIFCPYSACKYNTSRRPCKVGICIAEEIRLADYELDEPIYTDKGEIEEALDCEMYKHYPQKFY